MQAYVLEKPFTVGIVLKNFAQQKSFAQAHLCHWGSKVFSVLINSLGSNGFVR